MPNADTRTQTPATSDGVTGERWLTVTQMAEQLGISKWSAYQLVNAHPDHFTKRYRRDHPKRRRYQIAASQVDAFMASRPTEPDADGP